MYVQEQDTANNLEQSLHPTAYVLLVCETLLCCLKDSWLRSNNKIVCHELMVKTRVAGDNQVCLF